MTSPDAKCDILIVGEYFCDLVYHGLDAKPALGKEAFATGFDQVPGGSFVPAAALTKLGLDALWSCGLGTDEYSRFIFEAAKAHGIRGDMFTHVDTPLRRVTSVFSMREDRGFLTFVDGPDPLVDAAAAVAAAPKICLFQGLSTLLPNIAAAKALKDNGTLILADCGHTDLTLENADLRAAFQHVDVFLPNTDEARQLTNTADVTQSLKAFSEMLPSTVIKCGDQGAIGVQHGNAVSVPALDVDAIDLTGAGDSFNAGFSFGLLQSADFREAMLLGSACGALATTGLGISGLPDRRALMEAAERIKAKA